MSRKTYTLKEKTSGSKKISIFAMVSIAILAIFSFNNIIDNYVGMGLSATIAFIIAIVTFLFPFIFMIAEFASLEKSSKSGLTSWIHTSVGRKTAFITSFMFWFANLTYFFAAVPQRINFLSFAITGQDFTKDSLYMMIVPFVSVVFFALITFISTLNTKKLSRVISLGGTLMLCVTGVFFLMAIIGWIAGGINPSLLPDTEAPGVGDVNWWGETEGLNFAWISTFIWVLMAADGGQSLGVYVKDVKGGKKSFVKAMIISVCVIGGFYVFGTLLASVFPPVGGLASGWANAWSSVLFFVLSPLGVSQVLSQQIAYIVFGIIFFITSIGGLIIWTSAPVKVMFSEIAPGIFGSRLSKQNRNGVCSFGSWVQFIIVAPFIILLTWPLGESFSENLSLIKGAAGWIGMLPWIVIFVSYINLRLKKDHEKRSFRMGNRIFGITIGIFLSVVTILILLLTFFDKSPLDRPFEEWPSNWYMGPVMKTIMILLILVPAYLWYYFKYEYQLRDTKIALENKLDTKYALVKYSFGKKFVFWLNDKLYKDFVNEKNIIYKKALTHKKEIIKKIDTLNDKKDEFAAMLEKAIEEGNYLDVKKKLLSQEKEINVQLRALKKELRANKKESSIEIRKAKEIYNDRVKLYIVSIKSETKAFYEKTMNPLIAQYKENKKMKDIMKKELSSFQTKDIECDSMNYNDKKYADFNKIDASTYYSPFSPIKIDDKILFNNKELFIVKNFADSLVGEKYLIQNVHVYKDSFNKDIESISNGEWEKLSLVKFIHVENNQMEDFSIYVKDADSFVQMFEKQRKSVSPKI